jgi:hypothetical protein
LKDNIDNNINIKQLLFQKDYIKLSDNDKKLYKLKTFFCNNCSYNATRYKHIDNSTTYTVCPKCKNMLYIDNGSTDEFKDYKMQTKIYKIRVEK